MTDSQQNQPNGISGNYHQDVRVNASRNVDPDIETLFLDVTPAAARALLRLLIGVHRKRGKQMTPEEGA
ncbi:hypothetical protein [Actinoplanes sp. NPDC049802]|uniref:hypothetical protein n=1 Tax=Actinoplanes sp. NPDC049802 TaxID=3154742 RepID=UPI00340F3043